MIEHSGSLINCQGSYAIVAGRFNHFITDKLIQGAEDALLRHGISGDRIHCYWVPGAYEMPLVCRKLLDAGNHDAIIMRKAQTSSIPSHWIKNYNDVLGTPDWKWVTDVVIDDVRYVHGHKSSKARTAAKRDMQSTVTGHYHTDMYCEWLFGANKAVFALAVGCGIDSKSYAMGYMQGGKKEALGCGVVLDNGKTPICVKMDL